MFDLQGDADGAEEARRLCEQALQIEREIWGEDHPQVARTLNTLALVLKTQVAVLVVDMRCLAA